MSLCVRYVSEGKIKEEFLCFVDLYDENFEIVFESLSVGEIIESKMTGKKIGEAISNLLTGIGLDLDECVGQGFDGAAVMSSCSVGSVLASA